MKNLKIGVIAFLAIAALSSCSTITIDSAKSNANVGTIESIYVVLDMGSKTVDFNEAVRDNFKTAFEAHKIKATVKLLTGVEVNTDVEKETRDNGSNYALIVQLTEATGVSSGWGSTRQLGGVYDLSLFDITTKDRVWRAKEEIAGNGYGAYSESDVTKFVGTALESMAKDGLIPAGANRPEKQ